MATRLTNELHLRLVHPLSDGVVSDLMPKSFLGYLREKVDPERSEKSIV